MCRDPLDVAGFVAIDHQVGMIVSDATRADEVGAFVRSSREAFPDQEPDETDRDRRPLTLKESAEPDSERTVMDAPPVPAPSRRPESRRRRKRRSRRPLALLLVALAAVGGAVGAYFGLRGSGSDQPGAYAPGCGRGARGEVELTEDVGQVPVDRVLAEHQSLGDVLVALSLRDELQSIAFARRQHRHGLTRYRGIRPKPHGPAHPTFTSGIWPGPGSTCAPAATWR